MKTSVNQSNAGATSPDVVEAMDFDDPTDYFQAGLDEIDNKGKSQPTLGSSVEDKTVIPDEDSDAFDQMFLEQEGDDDEDAEYEEEDGTTSDVESEYEEVDEDEDDDDDDDETEDEEPEWFYLGHHSEYRTDAEAKKGIEAKDEYIISLEAASDEKDERILGLEQKLSMYSDVITEEGMRDAAILSMLPPEYQGKTDDDFDDDAELRAFWKAKMQAENQFERKQEAAAAKAKADTEARNARSKQAAKFVRDVATVEFFGISNPEDRNKLRKVLANKSDAGYTVIDEARMIAEVFGEKSAQTYLEGLRLDIQGEDVVASTKPGKSKSEHGSTHKVPPKKVVQKVKKAKVRKKTQITPPPKGTVRDRFKDADELTILEAGFAETTTR